MVIKIISLIFFFCQCICHFSYRKAMLCVLIMHSASLPDDFIRWWRFLVASLGYFSYRNMTSSSKDTLNSSFPIGVPLISFISPIVIVRRQELYWTGVERVEIFAWFDWLFSLFSMMLAVGLLYSAFIMLMRVPFP